MRTPPGWLPSAWPAEWSWRALEAAEADSPWLGTAKLHISDLVGGHEHPAPVDVVQHEHARLRRECDLQRVLDFLLGRWSVDPQLTRHRRDSDLDFHGSPRSRMTRRAQSPDSSAVLGQSLIPRQASRAISCSAASFGISRPVLSQYRALTCAIPTRAMPSRWASSLLTPASSAMNLLTMSAQSDMALSSRTRTAGSLLRSDSKTSRKVSPAPATKS